MQSAANCEVDFEVDSKVDSKVDLFVSENLHFFKKTNPHRNPFQNPLPDIYDIFVQIHSKSTPKSTTESAMLKSTPNPPRIHCEIHTRINTQILREGLFCIQAAVHHKAPALHNIVTANGPCKFKAWRLYGQDTSDFAAVQRRRQWPAPNTIDAPLHDAHGIGNAMDHGLATVGQGWD